MRVLVVLGHPTGPSLNRDIAERAVQSLRTNGHEVIFHDLYAEGFDPIMTAEEAAGEPATDPAIRRYADELTEADGIVIVHPNWWGMPPAMMKGWIDRAFRPGCAYAFEGTAGEIGRPVGLLKAATVLIFNTENSTEEMEREYFGDPLDALWKKNIFGLCGAREIYRRMFHGVLMSTPEIREAWLAEVEETVDRFFPVGARQAA